MKKFFYFIFISAVILSCGESGASEKQLDVITNTEKIYSFDDLKNMGFKKNREYDVEELTGASEAYFGFWGIKKASQKITK